MERVGRASSTPNWVGFEWDEAVELAKELGITLVKEVTAPPQGAGDGPLRVVRQREHNGRIVCTCAAEHWGEARC